MTHYFTLYCLELYIMYTHVGPVGDLAWFSGVPYSLAESRVSSLLGNTTIKRRSGIINPIPPTVKERDYKNKQKQRKKMNH